MDDKTSLLKKWCKLYKRAEKGFHEDHSRHKHLTTMISQNGQNDAVQVIAAEGEHKASRSLRLAAEVIADSPAALQVGLQIIMA